MHRRIIANRRGWQGECGATIDRATARIDNRRTA